MWIVWLNVKKMVNYYYNMEVNIQNDETYNIEKDIQKKEYNTNRRFIRSKGKKI